MNLTVYLREIKTPAHPRHCRDPEGGGAGIQMTGA